MARPPKALPACLPDAFGRGTALRSGVHPERLRRADLERVATGAYVVRGRADRHQQCLAVQDVIPHAVVSDATAARLWRSWHPFDLDPRLHVTTPRGTAPPHRGGLVAHERALRPTDVVELRGLRLTSPARTWQDLAASLTVADLVVMADGLRGDRTDERLAAIVTGSAGLRGAVALRHAWRLSRPGVRSARESLLRLVLLEAGFTDFVVNGALVTEERWVAEIDLWDERLLLGVEYDGDGHRERSVWRRDMVRRRRVAAADHGNARVLGFCAPDLRRADRLVAEVYEAALQQAARLGVLPPGLRPSPVPGLRRIGLL